MKDWAKVFLRFHFHKKKKIFIFTVTLTHLWSDLLLRLNLLKRSSLFIFSSTEYEEEEWSDWSPCSVTCGQGIQERTRFCNNPPPANGGLLCEGPNVDSRKCQASLCPGAFLFMEITIINHANLNPNRLLQGPCIFVDTKSRSDLTQNKALICTL